MSDTRGCFKVGCLGCLGVLAIVVLISAVLALLAWSGRDKQQVRNRQLVAAGRQETAGAIAVPDTAADLGTAGAPDTASVAGPAASTPGRLVLDLDSGDFQIIPGEPGEGVRVEARYDEQVQRLTDRYEVLPDSSWVYEVRLHRTMPLLQVVFRGLFGGDVESWVHVYVPPDVPIALEVQARQGGLEADLGGLWLREAEIRMSQGGFELDVSRPLREPMESLRITGRMGGLEASHLGNASPRALSIDYRMGGADLDLRGAWVRDCDVRLAVRMGGMSVTLPEEVRAVGTTPVPEETLQEPAREVPLPELRFRTSQSMGEIEFQRR